jgi:hypothetical protein
VALQALVPWCSSCKGRVGRVGMSTGEANDFRYYKRLGVIAKLAISYHGSLLLDSRVMDVPRAYNRTFVMLSSLKPFFFNSLQKELRFSNNAGA